MSDAPASASETPPPPPRTTGGGFRWEPPSAEKLQALMPGYTIEKILGRGGMGAVYKGVQENLDRTVAIKVLPPGVEKEDPSFAERFKSEAKLMAKLNHPAVVAVYDFGTTLGGQLYFAMEYVDGSDVSQMIRTQGRLPPEHALAITAHVCDALAAAHELGIVHRDIKPANVLLNMKGQVKVADFGLAKVEEPGQHGLTKTGYAMGTPDFVAPEVLMLGSSIDGRADLYAVGVMLYQMLTGEVPRGAFKPATARIPGLDRRYDPIIIKAMQSDREERYQSSAELRRDLDVILTVPLVKQDDTASAAIPVSQVAQMPAQRSAAQKPVGKPPQRSADAPVRQPNIKAGEGTRAPAKSKTPLFVGLGVAAAIGIGAFVMFSGGKKPAPSVVQASGLPVKAAGTAATPSPAPAKTAEPPKSEPKPVAKSASVTAATISASPRLPVTKDSDPKFPPGQWVKLFTKAEDLPNRGLKFEDGWIRFGKKKDTIALPKTLSGNYGVRLRFIRDLPINDDSRGPVAITVRQQPNGFDGYNALLATTSFVCNRREQGKDTKVLSVICPEIPKTGDEGTLEFFAVGSRLIGRAGTAFVASTTDAQWARGSAKISGSEDIRDIEVINLDGLPEAEALKILGVDEKGNDTRAAALAAEKLAMEQKQVAQAAASIPELATLDEQFKKLTAERVTAPFEAEVAKLNSGYLGGLDRKMAEEKASGHLDSVLALEAEKQLVQGAGVANSRASGGTWQVPLPEDDATSTTTPAVLKGLRQIYRDAYAKLEATRAANLKALTDPLTTRLKLLESDLTKKDRIADAKTVKEYREGLGNADTPVRNQTTGGEAAKIGEADRSVRVTAAALKDGFTNSLGMKFVPVKGTDVLFCIHETRRQDYAAYAAENPGIASNWKNPLIDGVPIGEEDDHPVVGITWNDAQGFCTWLSKKEGHVYRVPTDREWSYAVGIGSDETKRDLPSSLSGNIRDEYPWGTKWPPPQGASNYADSSTSEKHPSTVGIKGYTDGHPTTAPVMSFKPNKLGLFDLGGNVWEWCDAWYDDRKTDKVTRGGSWSDSTPTYLLSSYRRSGSIGGSPQSNFGFRIVIEANSKPTSVKPAPTTTPPPIVPPPAPATAAKSDFSNSLGMKFVKVPGTQVLFCIHETRYKDYAVYAADAPGVYSGWKDQSADGFTPAENKEDHPVTMMNWDDSKAFCVWLSKKESRTYRLPTDKEWSYAVGIGREEKWTKNTMPESLNRKVTNEFPWGSKWPPPKGAANYADTAFQEYNPSRPSIEGYTDGFPTTSPVMSFEANKLGLYDLGGNLTEWMEDWLTEAQAGHVLRGGSYRTSLLPEILSSSRGALAPGQRDKVLGFRIVVELTAP